MKRLIGFSRLAMLMLAMTLVAGCSSDSDLLDDDNNGTENGSGSGSGSSTTYDSSLSDLTSFDIAIDKTALSETETVPTEGDEAEDYIENNTFSNQVNIAFDGTSATTSGSVEGVTVTISGADVIVKSTAKKVCYNVSGTTSETSPTLMALLSISRARNVATSFLPTAPPTPLPMARSIATPPTTRT